MCHHNALTAVEADQPTHIQRMHVDKVEGRVLYGRGYDDLLDMQYPTSIEMKSNEHGLKKNDEVVVLWVGMQRFVFRYYNRQKALDFRKRREQLEGDTSQEAAEALVQKHGSMRTAARKENIGYGTLHGMRTGKPGIGNRLMGERHSEKVPSRRAPRVWGTNAVAKRTKRAKCMKAIRESILEVKGISHVEYCKQKGYDRATFIRPAQISAELAKELREDGICVPDEIVATFQL